MSTKKSRSDGDNVIRDSGVPGGVVVLRVKVNVAIGELENLPVFLMLLIGSCGFVAGLLRVNSVPSSVPAS